MLATPLSRWSVTARLWGWGSPRERGRRCWGRDGLSHPPPLRSRHHSQNGRKRLWVGAVATVGQATRPRRRPRPRLTDLRVSRGRVFHCFPGPGTERKLGSDGHKPDQGAGKISPLPHFLSRRRSERGKREKVGADAPRPPSCSLPVNAPERKVTGPLVVSWAGISLVLCGMGVFMGIVTHGYRRVPF